MSCNKDLILFGQLENRPEASKSIPCGQLLLDLIWKVIGIDFEFVELHLVNSKPLTLC